MSTCCWCTTKDSDKTSLINNYATKLLPTDELASANEDLCYCLECVDGYHKARDEVPSLHEVLWELETTRLILHFEKTMADSGEDDDLYIVEEDGETPFPCNAGPLSFEKHLRVPLLEILKYPYLLLNKRLSELCVLALCEMEKINYSYQVMDKHPGIYLLMVHPNEVIRRWAILTARNLGKVDRDDYYDIQEVLTCLFKVIELGLFECPDIYNSSVIEKGKFILLPSHLYDTSNYKNYWLGICMLLTVLEEEAMDSLLLGPDKQINFVQSIMSVMEKPTDDQSNDPFWPALHCFMVILDKLGSKVWGQPIDPVEAFQNIINNPSYKNEIKSIRESCTRPKSEPLSDYGDEMMTCSQIVYDYQTEKPQKDIGWKSAICPDYCPNLYEDMQTVADMLQCDIGQDMRLHNSTFLWFIPFVHSVMDLREGVAYNGEVIHHLCSEIREVHNAVIQYFDKVSEFFMWILVSVVELHHNKNCLHLLWITTSTWVEAVVKCAALPSRAILHGTERSARNYPRATATALSKGCDSIQSACMKLIRSLLKEGYQLGQKVTCEPFLKKLNLLVRCGVSHQEGWQLTEQEKRDLQACLKQVMRSIKDKWLQSAASGENAGICVTSPTLSIKQDQGILENRCPVTACYEHPSALRGNEVGDEDALSRSNGLGEMCKQTSCRAQIGRCLSRTSECLLTNTKQEPEESVVQESKNLNCAKLTNVQKGAQENGHAAQRGQSKPTVSYIHCSDQGVQNLKAREIGEEEERLRTSKYLTVTEKNHDRSGSSGLERNTNIIKSEKPSLLLKLEQIGEVLKRKNITLGPVGEKQQLVKGGNGSQKGQKGGDSRASCSTSNVLLQRKAEESSASISPGDPFSTNRPTELGSTLKGERDFQESDDDPDDNIPFKTLLQELKSRGSASAASLMTDSQVDSDLSKLSLATYASVINFPVDSSQESTVHCQSHITRKVQGVARSLSVDQSPDADKPTNQIIMISDSEEDENREPLKEKAGVCLAKQSSKIVESAQQQVPLTTCSSPLPYEECASQCFEFETEEDIYSAWQESQTDEKMAEEPCPSVKTNSHVASGDLEVIQQINDWGYDTDYLGDEVTEKAAEALEQQVKNGRTGKQQLQTSKGSKADTKHRASADKEAVNKGSVVSCSEYFTGVHAKDGEHSRHKDLAWPSTSTSVEEPPLGKNSAKYQQVKEAQSPKKRILKPSAGNTKSLQAKLLRSNSTDAPPKKDHHCQQPTVEKHGLKKTSQNAFRHSLASIAKSRSCGKTASESRLSEKKAKLIPAQKLVSKNRKMLACQERPCQQSTVEKLGLKKAPRKALELSQRSLDSVAQLRSHGKAVGDLGHLQKKAQKRVCKNRKKFACQERLSRQAGSKESGEDHRAHGATKSAKKAKPKQCLQLPTSRMVAENQKEGAEHVNGSLSSEKNQLRESSLKEDGFQVPPEPPLTRQDSTNPDTSVQETSAAVPVLPGTLYSSVTDGRKRDSVDVAISPSSHCDEGADPKESTSKLNENIDDDGGLFLTQMDAVDMELCSQEENHSHLIEMEINVPQSPMEDSGPEICNHAGCLEKVTKAGAFCREHSGPNSLNHVFTKPSAPARPPTAKLFSSSSSSRNANLAKELGNSSKSPVAQNVSNPPVSKADGFRSQTPTFSSILRPHNWNNAPQSQSVQNNHIAAVPKRPAILGTSAGHEVHLPSPQLQSVNVQQRDFKMFIKEVLKWNYSMFANFSQTGPPDYLRQSIVGPVPLKFQDYNDYFNTFFPLMMLNAFEMVAQDWLEIQRSKEQKTFILSLVSCSTNVESAHFTVDLSENDLDKQQHPKEDDLVFLTMSEKQSPSCEEENRDVCYVGLVTQFKSGGPTSSKFKKKVVCHLSIQTQGNLFRVSKQVRCEVVSSLLTTQRRFRALLLLRRSPLYKPIICPSYSYFCPRGLTADTKNTTSSEFNEDQRRAIETAYAMVTQEPSVPSICLIHGPPGTGKSKTILGLLDRILNERSRTLNPVQQFHTRRKQNRVLVCAPSNAAIDELMKKIILVFKEKCRDKEKCLGNCGDVNLVRLGQEKSIHKDVRPFSLYDLVERRINKKKPGEDQGCLKEKKAELDRQLDMLSRQRAMDRSEDKEKRQQLEEEICRLSKKRQQLASQLKQVHGLSQELKATIILESNIVCCTLSMSGLPLLESTFRRQGYDPFSCVIVDEAGQSCEVETLIPLIHGCKKLVLVGDPKQLPPTVKSRRAQDNGYDQSLMDRLCRHLEEQNWSDKLILQLQIQYRMHPDLCIFPSKYIYSGKLVTAEETERNRGSLEWPFLPYMFFDVYDGQEVQESGSYANPREARLVVELIKLIKEKKGDSRSHNIGVITPYNAQKRKITKELEKEVGLDRTWEVDTVDGFQGREKTCIIMSCVRAKREDQLGGSIGFLRNLQRLNVAITRAKYSLFILGHLETLRDNDDWNALIHDAEKRGAITKTSRHTYQHNLPKIFKKLTQTAVLPRTSQGPTGAPAGRRNEVPSRDSWPQSAKVGALPEGSGEVQPSPVSRDISSSSKKPPLPTQPKPVGERPQDPRLTRRAEPATKGTACREENFPASSSGSGVALPQNASAPLGQRTWSNITKPPASRVEAGSRLVSCVQPQGACLPATLPTTQGPDCRAPIAMEEARTLDRRDYCSRSRRTSEEPLEGRSPLDAKRRRTTY